MHPKDIPVETAEYILGINLKTARTLGIEVPDAVLKQADYIDGYRSFRLNFHNTKKPAIRPSA